MPNPPTPEQIKDVADRAEGKKPNKGTIGRPCVYRDTFPAQAEKLCALGATDAEMAEFFGITVNTFYKWKHDFPELSKSLKVGKEQADSRVERSLYHKAIGYKHDAVKIFMSKEGEPVYAPYVEHVPPDTVACIFWLKNRRPDLWRDKQEHEHFGTIKYQGLTDEQLDQRIAQALEQARADEAFAGISGPSGREEEKVRPN